MKNVMTPAEADRLQYLEEKHARRGLTDEEDVEMMELLVSQESTNTPVSIL